MKKEKEEQKEEKQKGREKKKKMKGGKAGEFQGDFSKKKKGGTVAEKPSKARTTSFRRLAAGAALPSTRTPSLGNLTPVTRKTKPKSEES